MEKETETMQAVVMDITDLHYDVFFSSQGYSIREKSTGQVVCSCPDPGTLVKVLKALEMYRRIKEIQSLG